MSIKLHSSFALHPGPWLWRNVIKHYDLTQTAAAECLGVKRLTLSNLIRGKSALSPEMAIRFEKAFGISAMTTLRMQSAYDLSKAKTTAKHIDVKRVPEPA